MALDATVAGASADSYLTVAAADLLAADDLGPEAERWTAPSTTVLEREQALKRATREIDAYVPTGYPPYATTQALVFPRSIDVVSGAPVIPSALKRAAYHQAAFVLLNAGTIDRASQRHARNLSQHSETGTSGTQGEDASSVMSPRALHHLAGVGLVSRSRIAGTVHSARVASGFPGAGA